MPVTVNAEHLPSLGRRAAIVIIVVLSTTLYSMSLLVASTVLPQMQGALSATADEIAWVMTFNILATAVLTPMTGWLTGRFGRRNVMVWGIFGFALATYWCGAATSLESLIVARVLQGAFGAPTLPLAQAILLDSFPKRHHGLVVGFYGMGVVIGPVLGPTLGGMLAEQYSWRWAFYMIVPVALFASVAMALILHRDPPRERIKLDWTGFLALSVAVACLQLVLARGQRLDWFDSPEIVLEAFVAVVAFYIFIAHSLTCARPFLNMKLLLNRNFSLGLLLVTIYGMLNFTPMVLLPPLLQQHAGFPDMLVGQVVSSRGIGAVAGFFLAMMIRNIDPRISMGAGFGLQVIAGLWLMSIDLNVTMLTLSLNAMLQGLAIGAIWIPLLVITFGEIESADLPEAVAIFHFLRNIGSSLFISLCVAEIVRTTGVNYGRMIEYISPFNEVMTMPWVQGGWKTDSLEGLARLSREINRQAAMLGYVKAFGMYTLASAIAIPLLLLIRRKRVEAVAV